jgi:hypothetical protein
MAHGVRGAANFERSNWLKVFELEVNLGRRFRRVKPNERRAKRDASDELACGVNVGKGRERFQ